MCIHDLTGCSQCHVAIGDQTPNNRGEGGAWETQRKGRRASLQGTHTASGSCDCHVTCFQLDKLREEGPGGGALVPASRHTPNMEAAVLLHNIQRIMQASYQLHHYDIISESLLISMMSLHLLYNNSRKFSRKPHDDIILIYLSHDITMTSLATPTDCRRTST